MGSSSSKVAGRAAGAASRRQYPSKPSIPHTAEPSTQPRPAATFQQPAQVRPSPTEAPPSDIKSQRIDLDGRDPDFGSALRKLGPAREVRTAIPNPSVPPPQGVFPSRSPATNPAIMIVQAREKIGKLWEQESENLGRGSFPGRTLISVKDIKEALRLRDEAGASNEEVERQMRLKPGLMSVLGNKGLVTNT